MTALSKLSDMKDSNNNFTLLHYIVDIIKRKFYGLLSFHKDVPNIDKASQVNTEQLE